MTANLEIPQSVLVYVGLDRVGDGLLKLPFVRGLRDAWPEAHITWVAGRQTSVYAGLLAPLVDGLLDEVIENAGIGLRPGEILRRPLAGRRFDLIIDSQRVFWASLVLKRIPHKSFISPAAGFLLSSRKPDKGYKFPKSMQRQLLDLLELASGKTFSTPDTLDIPLGEAIEKEAAELLPNGPVYVGFAPGSGGPPKRWPLENFVHVAKAQAAKTRTPVFFLGPKELDWLEDIKSAVPNARFPEREAGIGGDRPFNRRDRRSTACGRHQPFSASIQTSPPGRTTRTSSPSAFSDDARACTTPKQSAPSNTCAETGRAVTSATAQPIPVPPRERAFAIVGDE